MRGWLVYASAIGALWTFAVLWPMFDANERVPTTDGPMMVWNQVHNAECLLRVDNPYQTDLWLYPDGANLAKHTLSPGYAPVSLLVKWLSFGSPYWPFYAHRVIVFTSFALMWALTYLLLVRVTPRECTASHYSLPAFLAATCVVFSDFFIIHAQFPHFAAMWFFPLLALLLVRFIERPILPRAAWISVALGTSVYFTEMVVFWCMAVGILAALCYRRTIRLFLELRVFEWAICAGLALLIALPFLVAFLRMPEVPLSNFDGLLCATPLSMVVPNAAMNPLLSNAVGFLCGHPVDNVRASSFLGYTVPLLALLSLASCRKRECFRYAAALLAVSVALLIFSLGADLRVGDLVIYDVLPFAWVDGLPGLSTFRAPARLVGVALFVLAIPAVWAMSCSKWVYRAWPVFALLVCLEVPYSDRRMEGVGGWSDYCLRNVFAAPSDEYVNEVKSCGYRGGAWATMPPESFYDKDGVMAQVFHGAPLYGGLWSSRWEPGSDALFNEYYAAYAEALRLGEPGRIVQWLHQRGVNHVLLVKSDWSEADLVTLRELISVADVRGLCKRGGG